MSNFLELCKDMARDVGIPGSGPSSVTSSTLSEEENSIVRYIKKADIDIQSRWFDWDFLWAEANISTIIGTSTLTSSNTGFPTSLGNWKTDSLVWQKTTDDYLILDYMFWNEYRDTYKYGSILSSSPEVYAIKPDNNLDVYPTPDAVKTISAEYWKSPTEMSVDGSHSPIPDRFRKIIIARAKIYYAENEDAQEILEGALTEFEDLLDKLEADQLPRQKNRRFSQAQDLYNFTVVTE